ncbi:MAG: NADH-quinone oxidoreductase subunit N [Actinobacteria bacterium]|nr:NADH-quinone oxidoreductase subunit N [Actinomycetota bacterium]
MNAFLSAAPEVALAAAVVLLLMVEVAFKPRPAAWGAIAGAGLAAATGFSAWQWAAYRGADAGVFWHQTIAVDGFAAFAGMLVFPLAALGLMSAWRLAVSQGRRGAEFVALVLLAATGAHLMAAAADLVVLFIGLEIFSISLYVLAGFTRERVDADEASLKYFLLGAFASAVFLYGVALVFAATGSTKIYGSGGIARYLAGTIIFRPGVLLAGLALLLAGMAFKVSAAPFHVWAPDVYQGAPGGITGFLAASAKVAGFAALARVLTAALGPRAADWVPAVAVLAAVSVVVGTLLAIVQDDVKRLLAYSSVAHAGFILTALVAGRGGLGDMWFYLATYAVQVLGAFTVAAAVSGDGAGRSPLRHWAGLGRRSPWLAATMTLLLLAMGGIPLTAGFAGKVAVFRAAIDAGYLWLVIVALLATVAGLYFYLRVIVAMYLSAPEEAEGLPCGPPVGWGARLVLAVASAATLVLGVAPWPLLDLLRHALPL